MFAKLFLFALLALASSQAQPQLQEEDVFADIEVRGFLESALKALQKLERVLKEVVNKAVISVEKLLEAIRLSAKKVIEETTKKINDEVGKLLKEIEKLKQEAEDLGINLAECFGEEVDKIKNLQKQVVKDLIACVTSKVDEAARIIADSISEIKGVWKVYEQLKNNLKKCNKNIKCIIGVIANVAEKTVKLPSFALQQVAKVQKLLAGFPAEMTACGANVVSKIPIEGGKIVAEIAACVHDRSA